jgi:hypothetical protein
MSTHSTTAVIDRRLRDQDDKSLAVWFRHHDGYPDGNGAQLVKLIVEEALRTPEALVAAIEEHWTTEERDLGTGIPFYKPIGAHADYQFRYSVVYELRGEKTVCLIDCQTRDWEDGGRYKPETSISWLEQIEILASAVADWPEPPLQPRPRQRLSELSV